MLSSHNSVQSFKANQTWFLLKLLTEVKINQPMNQFKVSFVREPFHKIKDRVKKNFNSRFNSKFQVKRSFS